MAEYVRILLFILFMLSLLLVLFVLRYLLLWPQYVNVDI